MIRVSVIIPTFNRLKLLDPVFAALAAQSLQTFEVIVVDNGSTDGTEEALTARMVEPGPFPFRYIRITPGGPAKARNVGLASAEGEYLAFIDSDVELREDWMAICVAELDRDPGISAVGGVVVYGNDRGHVNSYGGVISRIGLAWDAAEGEAATDITAPEDRLWINCSAVLMRAADVRKAGGFDGRFFYGFEDSDLGWRVTAIGGPQRVLPNAICYHNVGDTIGGAAEPLVFHGCKNRLASLIANSGGRALALYLPIALAYALADATLRAPRRPKFRALLWNLRNLGGTLRRRQELAAVRVVADRDLSPLFAETLFPKVRLNGMRRRPNRVQAVNVRGSDDRVA